MSTDGPKPCFVIAPIGEEGSKTRIRSNIILRHIIKPIALKCGYEAIRADDISEPGMITSQVIQRLLDDPLVIADLTDQNPNVYYELAVRHAVRKPVVQIIEAGQTIPFDISQSRTISVNHNDLDSVAQCKDQLVKQIKAAETNPLDVDTPISQAVDLQVLKQSDNPLEKSNAEILSKLDRLNMILTHNDHNIQNEIRDLKIYIKNSLVHRMDDYSLDKIFGPEYIKRAQDELSKVCASLKEAQYDFAPNNDIEEDKST